MCVCVRVMARSVHKTVLPVIYANTLNQAEQPRFISAQWAKLHEIFHFVY